MRNLTATILTLILSAVTANAQALDVDWKMYGAASGDLCFYEAKGVSRTAAKLLRVWTKCLPQKDIDGINIEKDLGGKILENTARKVVDRYIPPIATIEDTGFDQGVAVIQYEQTANLSNLTPSARFLYEVDCPEQKLRELSIWVRDKGSSDRERPWTHAAPETNGGRLVRLLCAPQ